MSPNTPTALRIAFLDDDLDSREAFAEFLRMKGFEVDEFETGEEALAAFAVSMPAVVVMDITLAGGMDGYEAARQLRALPQAAGVQLVAMTGYSPETVKKQGPLFDTILTKPVDIDKLVALLKGLLPQL